MNQSILPPQYPSLFLHSVISPHPSTTSIHNNNNNYSGHDVMNDQQQQQQNVEYIYGICSDEQETKIAIQSSSPDIKLYALNHSMAFQGTLKGHSDQVHSIVYTQHSNHNTSAHSLASCSEDGSVCLFDTRVSNRPSHQVMMNMGPLYSIDIHKTNSHMLCVSGETTIQLRDMRRFNTSGASPSSSPASSSSSLLYTLDDIHTMMIRKVKFDSSTNRLFSSSDDGLVHVYDLNALSNNNNNSNIDPEDTLSGVINANNGVHQFGLCGAQSNIMYTVNHMHELNLWSMDTMNQIATGVNRSHLESVYPSHVNGGGEGTSSSMGDDDDNMMMMMPGDDMAVGMSHNYLIDANYFASADSLYAYVGTARGTVVICKIVINNGVTSYVPMAQLQNGHVDNTVVRCMWASKSGQFDRVITGGEDGRICVWSTKEATTQSTSPVLDKQQQQQQDLINDSAPSTTPSTTPSSRVQQHSARRNNGRNPYGGSGNNQRKRGGFNNKR